MRSTSHCSNNSSSSSNGARCRGTTMQLLVLCLLTFRAWGIAGMRLSGRQLLAAEGHRLGLLAAATPAHVPAAARVLKAQDIILDYEEEMPAADADKPEDGSEAETDGANADEPNEGQNAETDDADANQPATGQSQQHQQPAAKPPAASPSAADVMKQLTACKATTTGSSGSSSKNAALAESVVKCEPAALCKQAGVGTAPACLPAGTCAKLCQLAGNSCKERRHYLYDLQPGLLSDASQQDAFVTWWTAATMVQGKGQVSISCTRATGLMYGTDFLLVGPALCALPARKDLPGLAEALMLCNPSKAQPGLCAGQGIVPSPEPQCVPASNETWKGDSDWNYRDISLSDNHLYMPRANFVFDACERLCQAVGKACSRDLGAYAPADLAMDGKSYTNSAKDAKTGELLFTCTSRIILARRSKPSPAIMDSSELSYGDPPRPPQVVALHTSPPKAARPGRRGRSRAAG